MPVSAKSAIENYVIDRIDYGTVNVRPMAVLSMDEAARAARMDNPDVEERPGWAYVAAHSNTGYRYVVVATPMGSAASLREGGEFLVTVMEPVTGSYVLNANYLTCAYVADKFAHPVYPWVPSDIICVTRTIALALGVEDDAESAWEYLEKEK